MSIAVSERLLFQVDRYYLVSAPLLSLANNQCDKHIYFVGFFLSFQFVSFLSSRLVCFAFIYNHFYLVVFIIANNRRFSAP